MKQDLNKLTKKQLIDFIDRLKITLEGYKDQIDDYQNEDKFSCRINTKREDRLSRELSEKHLSNRRYEKMIDFIFKTKQL